MYNYLISKGKRATNFFLFFWCGAILVISDMDVLRKNTLVWCSLKLVLCFFFKKKSDCVIYCSIICCRNLWKLNKSYILSWQWKNLTPIGCLRCTTKAEFRNCRVCCRFSSTNTWSRTFLLLSKWAMYLKINLEIRFPLGILQEV